jgi:hypothetical protein
MGTCLPEMTHQGPPHIIVRRIDAILEEMRRTGEASSLRGFTHYARPSEALDRSDKPAEVVELSESRFDVSRRVVNWGDDRQFLFTPTSRTIEGIQRKRATLAVRARSRTES